MARMTRAERRRQQKLENKKTTYTFTKERAQEEVEKIIKEQIEKEKAEIMNDAINQAMLLLLVLPMKVLMVFIGRSHTQRRSRSLPNTCWIITLHGKKANWIWIR